MAVLRLVLVLLAALMFVASGVARAMPPPDTAPPCHEHAPARPDDHGKPALAATNCCLGCMPAPQAAASLAPLPLAAVIAVAADPAPILRGRSPPPELHPPRLTL